VLVLAQNGGKQLYQRHTADRRTHVEPGAVLPYLHVDVAAEWRIPAFHRRQALAGAGRTRDQRLQSARIGGLGKTLFAMGPVMRKAIGHRHEIVTVVALVSLSL